jgi:REP element-mobilizing transposase RayT
MDWCKCMWIAHSIATNTKMTMAMAIRVSAMLCGGALWSPSYFAGSCGGAALSVIRQYIELKQTPS